jgi:flagellin FlaB
MMMNNNENNNEIGSIGIGAMIVFIALILVAAVASAVIIQTGEKLQQNAQQTGDDTVREIGGKVTINGVLIVDTSIVRMSFESAPGSGILNAENIAWQVSCDNGGYNFVAAAFEDGDDTDVAEVGDTFLATDPDNDGLVNPAPGNRITTITPGVSYVIDMDLDGGVAGADCAIDDLNVNDQITMWIHVEGGGSTYERLTISDTTPGAALV